ncbi:MAG: response regulator transcription factor [Gammaproteobacteria bacterium]|nr:response regulator transcription factor [Gammaproteobacteria bacterium]MCP4091054.1 response regulator transcription factor [Gammaproteobacteria bacterium]MCP4277420.1 response regulator transcription factor [Gammaproteobacteria bacterium]MCP4831519.1 response regulator transcription factor [Gammaproteobacteria bacterium]MCP4927742.1 response regulator transcription factor [Gammaproteobacteria bacterium]
MSVEKSRVFIVDDDDAVRDSLCLLFKTVDIEAIGFESGDKFLLEFDADWQGCIILDIRMPGTSGLEVQKLLSERDCTLPIIFITGHGDVPMAVEAMQLGAFDFIQKPFRDQELMDRVAEALSSNEENKEEVLQKRHVTERYATLTPRETEVMQCVVKGQANKVIALDLEVSQRTVEIHRARVMEKMAARSLAALVRMSLLLEN